MALPILAASVLATVAFGLVYLKRVVEPDLLRLDALEAARGTPSLSAGARPGTRTAPGSFLRMNCPTGDNY